MRTATPEPTLRQSPLVSAGTLLGAGLGGFVDGILLHQIFQWHNMLSARLPPDTLVNAKINMVWDGFFHATVWLLCLLGVYGLIRAGKHADTLWSEWVLTGALLRGWGLFNLIEGIIDHHLLQLHHVYDYASQPLWFDLGFLVFGVLLILAGEGLIRAGLRRPHPPGWEGAHRPIVHP